MSSFLDCNNMHNINGQEYRQLNLAGEQRCDVCYSFCQHSNFIKNVGFPCHNKDVMDGNTCQKISKILNLECDLRCEMCYNFCCESPFFKNLQNKKP